MSWCIRGLGVGSEGSADVRSCSLLSPERRWVMGMRGLEYLCSYPELITLPFEIVCLSCPNYSTYFHKYLHGFLLSWSRMYQTCCFLGNKLLGLGISWLAPIISKKGLGSVERLLQIPVMFYMFASPWCVLAWWERQWHTHISVAYTHFSIIVILWILQQELSSWLVKEKLLRRGSIFVCSPHGCMGSNRYRICPPLTNLL